MYERQNLSIALLAKKEIGLKSINKQNKNIILICDTDQSLVLLKPCLVLISDFSVQVLVVVYHFLF